LLQNLGLSLWANSVVPVLFPFFVATELLSSTNIINILGKSFSKIMEPLFNVPGEGSFPLIMGIITGYPVGAKIVSKLKDNGTLTDIESERLISFTNNSGPLFILGTVGIGLFGDAKTGVLLLLTHILSCITVGFIFRWWKFKKHGNYSLTKKANLDNSKIGFSISSIIMQSINTILLIGGFIVLFSVIISILVNSKIMYLLSSLINPILNIFGFSNIYAFGTISGLFELTNGVYIISSIVCKQISNNIIICAFLMGFGGLSVAMQVFAIISKSHISIKPYLIGKILHGFIAATYTYMFLYYCPFFNLNL
jgi:sporulation integral membrane protein YlbJ